MSSPENSGNIPRTKISLHILIAYSENLQSYRYNKKITDTKLFYKSCYSLNPPVLKLTKIASIMFLFCFFSKLSSIKVREKKFFFRSSQIEDTHFKKNK